MLIIVLLVIFAINPGFTQKQGMQLIDSLKSELTKSTEDTSKVRLLGKISFQYYQFDTDLGIYYAEQAIRLAEKLNWGLGIAFSYNYLGTNYAVKGNHPKALEFFSKSLSKYTEIGDKQGMAFLLNNLGNFYRIRNETAQAIEFLTRATVINKEFNNKMELARNYNNLGNVYNSLSDFSRSNDYYYKALKIADEINNKELAAKLLVNIAENKTKTKDYCSALELSYKAIKISEELKADYDIAAYYSYLGEIYFKISIDSNKVSNNCKYYSFDKLKNLLSAKKYLTIAIALLNKINDLSLISENSLLLSRVYENLNDSKKALSFYKKYSDYKDSVFSSDNSIKIAKLEKEREVESRDKQIKIQTLEIEKKNSQINYQVVLFILFLFSVSLSLYFYYNHKADKALRKNEEKLTQLSLAVEQSPVSIVITDLAGNIEYINPKVSETTGYTFEELIGKNPRFFSSGELPKDEYKMLWDTITSGHEWTGVFHNKKKNGELYWESAFICPIKDENGKFSQYLAVKEDITENKISEDKIKISLKEKESLLRELYHRTKNNMQVISAILTLKSSAIKDQNVISILNEMQNRIKSMALVHQKLYQSQDLSHVDLDEYIYELANLLFSNYHIENERIKLNLDLQKVEVLIDSAIPCGLIINELVSNSLKYAFPDCRHGEISISLKKIIDDSIELKVTDNGIGISDEIELKKLDTLGYQLIQGIAADQLQGEVIYNTSNGVHFQVTFKDDLYSPRV